MSIEVQALVTEETGALAKTWLASLKPAVITAEPRVCVSPAGTESLPRPKVLFHFLFTATPPPAPRHELLASLPPV